MIFGSSKKGRAGTESSTITFLSAVNELTSVHAFNSQEMGSLESVFIRVSEDDFSEGSTTAGVVKNLSNDSLDISKQKVSR